MSEVNVAQLARDVHSAISDLRSAFESKNEDTTRNIQAFLDRYEEHVAQPRAAAAANDRKRIELLEEAVSTGAPLDAHGNPDWSKTAFGRADSTEWKSFMSWLSDGKAREFVKAEKGWRRGDLELKALRTDSESAGGYLVPQVMDSTIRKNIIEVTTLAFTALIALAAPAYAQQRDPWTGFSIAVGAGAANVDLSGASASRMAETGSPCNSPSDAPCDKSWLEFTGRDALW